MIKEISSFDTYKVRHPMLRAEKNIQSCKLNNDNDATTKHFGYFVDDELVGVVSVFENNSELFKVYNQFQIRAMAVLNEFQNQQIGSKLIHNCEDYILSKNGNLIWFNARINAIAFYKKLQFDTKGNYFEIPEIGQHIVMFKHLVD